ncbi:hypothetical protein H072_203 [Dactylellina haptotyla CBS 200.50]|uniref:BTB domain-containing protein n=1 Tax=Dactylellina haptotyla (strain CBS 200.50) TaxID=1284197 RepID=S8CDY3_DACHA|nr:hypothetical protein H072_203 [Dactylellina haptotyla CBS 200.50]
MPRREPKDSDTRPQVATSSAMNIKSSTVAVTGSGSVLSGSTTSSLMRPTVSSASKIRPRVASSSTPVSTRPSKSPRAVLGKTPMGASGRKIQKLIPSSLRKQLVATENESFNIINASPEVEFVASEPSERGEEPVVTKTYENLPDYVPDCAEVGYKDDFIVIYAEPPGASDFDELPKSSFTEQQAGMLTGPEIGQLFGTIAVQNQAPETEATYPEEFDDEEYFLDFDKIHQWLLNVEEEEDKYIFIPPTSGERFDLRPFYSDPSGINTKYDPFYVDPQRDAVVVIGESATVFLVHQNIITGYSITFRENFEAHEPLGDGQYHEIILPKVASEGFYYTIAYLYRPVAPLSDFLDIAVETVMLETSIQMDFKELQMSIRTDIDMRVSNQLIGINDTMRAASVLHKYAVRKEFVWREDGWVRRILRQSSIMDMLDSLAVLFQDTTWIDSGFIDGLVGLLREARLRV